MTDNGLVIATDNGLAEVEVSCFEGCHSCAARSLCIGNKQKKGHISVKNPLQAKPGDNVKIEIPENQYGKALSLLFGGLLTALLVGLGGGYMIASLFSFSLLPASVIGLAAGLVLGGLILSVIFRRNKEEKLYPVIIDILKKGDHYGPA
jgi:positive regulator of sigma E activity